jgi:hypothetical protein
MDGLIMPSIISTKTSGGGGIAVTGDTSGVMQLASANGTTAVEIDASQVFKFNSGYGSVATAYGCRAWVNFNGTGTVAIRASGNVTSITDHATGNYTVNFTTAMPDINYSVSGSNIGSTIANTFCYLCTNGTALTTSGFRFNVINAPLNTATDNDSTCISVFR